MARVVTGVPRYKSLPCRGGFSRFALISPARKILINEGALREPGAERREDVGGEFARVRPDGGQDGVEKWARLFTGSPSSKGVR